ncbi:MAG: DNA polymerase III subunit beta [Myxococcales bacterium FL481]|nr:MAG: DNA polymerase III subunit beta [Myxococcales bacterium FL481]
MQFEIDQSSLHAALALAATVADQRASMQVLGNVLLEADSAGTVTCRATDMMLFVTESFPAQVTRAGSISLGVRHLHELVKALPAGKLTFERLDNHWAHITTARSDFKLMGMPQHDFPEAPRSDALTFTPASAKALGDLITRVVFSVSTDESRVNLNGALFECDGAQATMVSTDGHRLTKYSCPFAGPDLTERGGVVIPRRGLIEMRRVLDRIADEIELAVSDEHLFLRGDNLSLCCKLTTVAFPPYDQVIPTAHQRYIEADRSELVGLLKQAEVLAPEKTATIRLELAAGQLKLTADNPELGVGHQEMEVDYDGDAFAAGFNARYLIEGLDGVACERIRLEFQGELDPCVVRPVDGPEYLAVVMPMRI